MISRSHYFPSKRTRRYSGIKLEARWIHNRSDTAQLSLKRLPRPLIFGDNSDNRKSKFLYTVRFRDAYIVNITLF